MSWFVRGLALNIVNGRIIGGLLGELPYSSTLGERVVDDVTEQVINNVTNPTGATGYAPISKFNEDSGSVHVKTNTVNVHKK